MRIRFVVVALGAAACGGAKAQSRGVAHPEGGAQAATAPMGVAPPSAVAEAAPMVARAEVPSAVLATGASGAPAAVGATGSATVAVAKPARPEMLDIEAFLTLEAEPVADAAAALRAAAKRFDGVVVEDTLTEQAGGASAHLTIRVPTEQAERFFDAVNGVGKLRSRRVSAKDIGKDYFDAELRLQNLVTTMRRYEEILKQARDVNEILRVESELGRLRGEIEQTKGNLRWLSDRAARATIHVELVSPARAVVAQPPPESEPEAKLYPGLRLTWLGDLRGEEGNQGYWGAGLSATISRHFAIHIDGLRASGTGSPFDGLDVVLVSLGGEMYSDFLGGGKRKFLNPYLGYTIGYARFTGHDQGMLGITAGLELLKTGAVVIEAQVRSFGLVFSSLGGHVAIQPVLAGAVAF